MSRASVVRMVRAGLGVVAVVGVGVGGGAGTAAAAGSAVGSVRTAAQSSAESPAEEMDDRPSGSGGPRPVAFVDKATVSVGDTLRAQGRGWPAGELVTVSVCGNRGASGSVDCDTAGAASAPVQGDGSFVVPLRVGPPPSACPCTVSFRVPSGASHDVFVHVAGAPGAVASGAPTGQRVLRVQDARIEAAAGGIGALGAALGLPVGRQLVMDVANEGRLSVADPQVSLAAGSEAGDGAAPTGSLDAPALGTLAPGERRTVQVPVAVPLWGRVAVLGEIHGLDEPAPIGAATVNRPWWLAFVAAAVVAGLFARRRRGRDDGRAGRSAFEPQTAGAVRG